MVSFKANRFFPIHLIQTSHRSIKQYKGWSLQILIHVLLSANKDQFSLKQSDTGKWLYNCMMNINMHKNNEFY